MTEKRCRSQTPIGHAVFVEVHESIEETEWVLELARQHPFIKGNLQCMDNNKYGQKHIHDFPHQYCFDPLFTTKQAW